MLCVDDPALHPASLQERRGEAAAQEVRAHPEVPALGETEEHVRGHPDAAQVCTSCILITDDQSPPETI